MLSNKMLEKFNFQINREIYSAYFYLGMAMYADSIGFKGVGNWFKKQWAEELFHAEKMYDYVTNRGSRVVLEAIERPPQDFTSIKELFETTLAHEKKVTSLIHGLVDTAKQENDKESEEFLKWYVKEQVEEEEAPQKTLDSISSRGEGDKSLLEVDKELAKRK